MAMTPFDPDRAAREKLLNFAKQAGASAADAIAIRAQNLDVAVRKGVLEDASRAESFGIGLRVFKGHRHAYGSSADASDEGLRRLAQHVAEMADAVPEDPHTYLADETMLCRDPKDLDLYDASTPLSISQLGDMARQAEAAAMSVKGITNSDAAHAGQNVHWIGLSTSNGFCGGYAHSGTHLSVSVIGGSGETMETDHAGTQTTFAADLETPEIIGKRAAERTLARLNPTIGKTGAFPVIFDRRASSSLLRSLTRCISGPRLAKGTSFLNGKLGEKICGDAITIIDDPLKARGLRSSPFDAEGVCVAARNMVEGGVLKSYYLDLRSADRLGMRSTGHATRGLSSPPSPSPSNAWIAAGKQSQDEMIAAIGEGFLITDLMGASISLATGDYSRGASGFWIEGGAIAYAVSEMTIAGNLAEMFLSMVPASDLEFRSGIDAPSLLVEGLMVATR